MKTITKIWHYLLNPFLIATESSYFNGLEISTYHDNALEKLKGDPVILAMYNTYHPLHVDYKSSYTKAHRKRPKGLAKAKRLADF